MLDKIKKYIMKVVKILSLKELRILPAYLSYSFVLAIIPMLTIIVIIAGLFSISMGSIVNLLNQILPEYASNLIINALSVKNFNLSIGFLNIVTIYVASKGMQAIITSSNSLYKLEGKYPIKNFLKAFLILGIFILIIVFLMIVPVLGDKIINFLSNYAILNNIINDIRVIYQIVKWPSTFLLVFLCIKLLYVIAPSVKVKGSDTTLGAFFTTLGWTLFTLIFSYYVTYFGKYDILYGGLSNITIFLIWIYALSYIFVMGMVINTIGYNKK